jgi:hypothetical protein
MIENRPAVSTQLRDDTGVVVLVDCAMGGHVGANPTVSVNVILPGYSRPARSLSWRRSFKLSSRHRPQPAEWQRRAMSSCSARQPP